MSLRASPVEATATLPDGRAATVWVGVPDDPYIDRAELDTVAIELRIGDEVVAALNTILDPGQESEAGQLVRAVVAGLEDGTLAPTAGALEPLADSIL
ncbi:MAG: hypothetical protein ACM33B_09380 [Pseudomonadota bacterium]